MATTLYKEKQRYTDVPNLVALSLLLLGLIYGSYSAYVQPQNAPASPLVFAGLAVLVGGALWYLTRLRMKVTINEDHIKFKVSPIHAKKRKIAWNEVERCEVVETPAIAQWQGGNINFEYEKSVTFTGRNGLSITTTDGTHYFIGSRKPRELEDALKHLSF